MASALPRFDRRYKTEIFLQPGPSPVNGQQEFFYYGYKQIDGIVGGPHTREEMERIRHQFATEESGAPMELRDVVNLVIYRVSVTTEIVE